MIRSTYPLTGNADVDEVVHAHRLAHAFFDAVCARSGHRLNRIDTEALTEIRRHGRIDRVRDLSDRLPLSRAATTSLVDRLERADLVQRVVRYGDRRRFALELTDRGERIVDAACTEAAEIIVVENELASEATE